MSGDWLLDWLSLARLPHIVDIGANPIDGDTPYKALIAKQLVKVTGFEPQEAALQVLNQRKTAMETYLPYVIGNGGKSTLNVCQYSGWTSLKKPRQAALEVFNQFKESAEIVETLAVTCKKLDSVHDASDIDMLKIDAQGAELDVLRGATKKLKNAVIVHSEISFVNLYEDQPTFAQIDIFLRAQGFIPHTFADVKRALVSPIYYKDSPSSRYNQILEAEIVYVRDYFDFSKFSTEQIKILCFLVYRIYRSFDLAARCVLELTNRGVLAGDTQQIYLDHLNRDQFSG